MNIDFAVSSLFVGSRNSFPSDLGHGLPFGAFSTDAHPPRPQDLKNSPFQTEPDDGAAK
jgi:hypothetical protein